MTKLKSCLKMHHKGRDEQIRQKICNCNIYKIGQNLYLYIAIIYIANMYYIFCLKISKVLTKSAKLSFLSFCIAWN